MSGRQRREEGARVTLFQYDRGAAGGAHPAGERPRLTDAEGAPLPAASRTSICKAVGEEIGFKTQIDGAWYRCCGGHVRKLVDCCSRNRKRINGDASLTGYCYKGRRVFCVMYFQSSVPC